VLYQLSYLASHSLSGLEFSVRAGQSSTQSPPLSERSPQQSDLSGPRQVKLQRLRARHVRPRRIERFRAGVKVLP
jgi:hypothetical protein